MNDDWKSRIVSNPAIHHGEPCIKGTRVSVATIVASLADFTVAELLQQFPQLTSDDIKAALRYAAVTTRSSMVA
jgi:uncharacterized protein (DUF433 family)